MIKPYGLKKNCLLWPWFKKNGIELPALENKCERKCKGLYTSLLCNEGEASISKDSNRKKERIQKKTQDFQHHKNCSSHSEKNGKEKIENLTILILVYGIGIIKVLSLIMLKRL